MKQWKYLLLGLTACFLFSCSSLAEVFPLNQNRNVFCSATAADDQWGESEADSAYAPDLEPFIEDVSAQVYIGSVNAQSWASQLSVIGPKLFGVYGNCSTDVAGFDYVGSGTAQSRSYFECEFEVISSTVYILTGTLGSNSDGSTTVELNGPGISLYLSPGSDDYLDLKESGILEPGVYVFTTQSSSSSYGDFYQHGWGWGSIDLELAFRTISAAPLPDLSELDLVLSPNPFSHRTEIAYAAPSRRTSSVEIFDLRGRLIRRLVTGNSQSGVLSWDGKNSRGQAAATGTYFVVLKSGNEIRREKAVLVR